MTDVFVPLAMAFAGGGLFGGGVALFFADRVFRKTRGPQPAVPLPWYDFAPSITRQKDGV